MLAAGMLAGAGGLSCTSRWRRVMRHATQRSRSVHVLARLEDLRACLRDQGSRRSWFADEAPRLDMPRPTRRE